MSSNNIESFPLPSTHEVMSAIYGKRAMKRTLPPMQKQSGNNVTSAPSNIDGSAPKANVTPSFSITNDSNT